MNPNKQTPLPASQLPRTASFTPGPWIVDCLTRKGNANYNHLVRTGEGDEFPIVAVVPSQWTPQQDDDESEANARLIASAPALLEALQKCLPILEAFDQPGHHTQYGEIARAVIAAALGQP